MTIQTICKACKGSKTVKDPATGKNIRCQSCGGLGYQVSQVSKKS